METKSLGKFELKADGNDGHITGYGAFFGNVDSVDDVIHEGSFKEINRSVKMLYQHRTDKLIGVWDTVQEDPQGLIVSGKINTNTTVGKDVYELAKSGALTDLSVGFCIQDYSYDKEGVRHIRKADLYEVSLVSFPANKKANIMSVKSDDITTERDFEHALKKMGFSNKQAKLITIKGYKAFLHERDNQEKGIEFTDIIKDLKSFKI